MLLVINEDVVNTPGIQQIDEWSVRRLSRRGWGQHVGSAGMVVEGDCEILSSTNQSRFSPILKHTGRIITAVNS